MKINVDNLSVNSGMVSDNYTGFNTSTIEQISVLTGGYNAEYGEGRSAVVNIVSKEAPKFSDNRILQVTQADCPHRNLMIL